MPVPPVAKSPAKDDSTKKPAPKFQYEDPSKKVKAANSGDAAAEMLKQFYHRKP